MKRIILATVSAAALSLGAGSALAQSNTSLVNQTGSNGTASVSQSGGSAAS